MIGTSPFTANEPQGLFTCAVASLANGSFAVPMKRIKNWRWEHTWLAYSLFAYGILPTGLALALAHRTLIQVFEDGGAAALRVAFFGALWGVGAVLFGLSLTRLGIAVATALIPSIIVLAGSLGPLLAGAAKLSPRVLQLLLLALTPLIADIALCAAASIIRDRTKGLGSAKILVGRHPAVGIILAFAAGILSSMLNIGFAFGNALAEEAKLQGYPAELATLAVWVPALTGGLVIILSYPGLLIQRAESWSMLHSTADAGRLWLRCIAMAAIWFGAILLYGFGASLNGADRHRLRLGHDGGQLHSRLERMGCGNRRVARNSAESEGSYGCCDSAANYLVL